MLRRAIVPLLATFFVVVPMADSQVVVQDPVQTAATQFGNSVLQAHATFMKLQMVQDAEILKNNFLQAESYYNYINARSKSRGGLMGYYSQMVTNEVDTVIDAQKMSIENDANNVTGATFVNDLAVQATNAAAAVSGGAMNAGVSALNSGVNAANAAYGGSMLAGYNSVLSANNATRAVAFQRNMAIANSAGVVISTSYVTVASLMTSLNDLKKQANVQNLDDQTYESLNLSIAAVQAQLTTEVHRMLALNAQLLKAQLDTQNLEQAFSRQTAADMASFYNKSVQQRSANGTDANAVITELNRQPQ
jgi:hypothetical protein